jgi:XTP/dITP diphosphohydrolase
MTAVLSRVVLASGNAGKLREMQALLEPLGIELRRAVGDSASPTPRSPTSPSSRTRSPRRAMRARTPACRRSQTIPASACAALGGAPGVRSARCYRGRGRNPMRANNARLAARARRPADRRALLLLRAGAGALCPDDPQPVIADGPLARRDHRRRRAARAASATTRISCCPQLGRTAAELDAADQEPPEPSRPGDARAARAGSRRLRLLPAGAA